MDLKRRGGTKGQGQRQVLEVDNHNPLESANPERSQRDSVVFFEINDSVTNNSVVIPNSSYTCAYPATCQNSQLTIGQTQTTNMMSPFMFMRKTLIYICLR